MDQSAIWRRQNNDQSVAPVPVRPKDIGRSAWSLDEERYANQSIPTSPKTQQNLVFYLP